jgi:nucleotide-binding universal stress UspA family protein
MEPVTANAVRTAKYLVCVDAREESRVALRLACMKAQARGNSVGMLHVIAPVDFQTLGGVAERMREERHKEAEELLNGLAADAAAAFGVTPSLILREGLIGDEIVQAALDDANVNMVVIGVAQQSNTRGKLAAWLAGQLGAKLFIPLLMVPGNLTDQQLQTVI